MKLLGIGSQLGEFRVVKITKSGVTVTNDKGVNQTLTLKQVENLVITVDN
jgi:hypothetical protein